MFCAPPHAVRGGCVVSAQNARSRVSGVVGENAHVAPAASALVSGMAQGHEAPATAPPPVSRMLAH
jgi:hypothetical protein